ncbi:MAG: ferritin-like domain-containing protein [Alphaproteobacteria bacterium]|nr:ferritin-like domain-containing protein [Alphaproteobacteria bacterium]MBV9063336.1 ferritin-like domain-containing protein [Alphaproteobacteria bacterium]
MTSGTVYTAGWSLDDIPWDRFDRSKASPGMIAAVKAAALVEFNAPAYVSYLARVFEGAERSLADFKRWGDEEAQHGLALGRWAEMADPAWSFEQAFARFQTGYKPPHFTSEETVSVRGSRRGEMIARCVVESGTSSYYSAIREAADEPVLKEIAGRIAADEFRHYRLFFDTLHAQDEPELPFWRRLLVALGRINESDDDELAYAYYCATVGPDEEAANPYRRSEYARQSFACSGRIYRRHHIRKLVQMVAKAVGADPQGRITSWAAAFMWRLFQFRAGSTLASAPNG